MLAWKEKVADRLSRLLADSPVSPSPGPAAVQPPLVRSAPLAPYPLPRSGQSHCAGAISIFLFSAGSIGGW